MTVNNIQFMLYNAHLLMEKSETKIHLFKKRIFFPSNFCITPESPERQLDQTTQVLYQDTFCYLFLFYNQTLTKSWPVFSFVVTCVQGLAAGIAIIDVVIDHFLLEREPYALPPCCHYQ